MVQYFPTLIFPQNISPKFGFRHLTTSAERALAGLTPEAGQGANAASANGDHPPRLRPRGATSAELRAEAQQATQRVDREGFRLAMRLLELRNFFDFGVDRTALVEDSHVCSICQVDFERNDNIMPWPGPCGDSAALAVQPHIFHRACLANYVASNLRLLEEQNESLPCPICRSGSRRSVEFGAEELRALLPFASSGPDLSSPSSTSDSLPSMLAATLAEPGIAPSSLPRVRAYCCRQVLTVPTSAGGARFLRLPEPAPLDWAPNVELSPPTLGWQCNGCGEFLLWQDVISLRPQECPAAFEFSSTFLSQLGDCLDHGSEACFRVRRLPYLNPNPFSVVSTRLILDIEYLCECKSIWS